MSKRRWSRRSDVDTRHSTLDTHQNLLGLLFGLRAAGAGDFLTRVMRDLLRRLLDDPDQAVMLGAAERTAFGDLDLVALAGLALLVVHVVDTRTLQVLAVLGVLGLVLHDDLD